MYQVSSVVVIVKYSLSSQPYVSFFLDFSSVIIRWVSIIFSAKKKMDGKTEKRLKNPGISYKRLTLEADGKVGTLMHDKLEKAQWKKQRNSNGGCGR